MRRWSERDIGRARNMLGHFRQDEIGSAVSAIGDLLKAPITYDELRGAFRRRGLGPLTDWCLDGSLAYDHSVPSLFEQFDDIRRTIPVEQQEQGQATGGDKQEPTDRLLRLFCYPDIHAPYHSEPALQVALAASHAFDPDIVWVAGDEVDCLAVSSYPKDPNRKNNLEYEIDSARDVLRRIDAAAPNAQRKIFTEGNHEFRLSKYLQLHAPAVYNLLSIRQLLGIDEMGWEWVPYRSHTTIGKLHVTHECGNAGPWAAAKARDAFESNAAIGHTHRMCVTYSGSVRGDSHVGAMFGWLGDADQIDYMHKVNARHWQLGFGTGHIEQNGNVHLQAHPIIDERAVVNGQIVRAA